MPGRRTIENIGISGLVAEFYSLSQGRLLAEVFVGRALLPGLMQECQRSRVKVDACCVDFPARESLLARFGAHSGLASL